MLSDGLAFAMGYLFYEWHHNIKMQIALTATRGMRPKRFDAVYFCMAGHFNPAFNASLEP
jgi:hypothetical protein